MKTDNLYSASFASVYVELAMDEEGREVLFRSIQGLTLDRPLYAHDHLMTEPWAGAELTEEVQNADNQLINQLNVYPVRP